MSGHGEKLSRYQERAVVALLTQPTVEEAASHAGVSASTLRRWLAHSPEFKARYRAARREVVEHAVAELQHATSEAVATLRRNMGCGEPGPEIRAAVAVLKYALEGLQAMDVDERLDALERRLDQ